LRFEYLSEHLLVGVRVLCGGVFTDVGVTG